MNLQQLNEKIQNLNPIKAFSNFVNDNPTLFIDLLKEQLIQGKSGEGFIRPLYASVSYAKEKQARNPKAGGNPDLHDTGDFYDGIKLKTSFTNTSGSIEFYSSDSKNASLTNKYSIAIWEYNEETIAKLKPEILRDFKNYLW